VEAEEVRVEKEEEAEKCYRFCIYGREGLVVRRGMGVTFLFFPGQS
jgi:hypothetical protein